jgi:hypothetical protein
MTQYHIGLQNFQGLREDGKVYVDQTAQYKIGVNFSNATQRIEEWKMIP